MHTARELRRSSFEIRVAGHPAGLEDVLPGFTESDRLGVVVRRPGGAAGASLLILAAVTAFYDAQRAQGDDFFVYPDYFLFHVGSRLGDHRRLDIWPGHKEVVVPDDPESLLQAVNDRAVTRLLVTDAQPGRPAFAPETVASARGRIVSCLAYSADGSAARADVAMRGDAVTEGYVTGVLERSATGARAAPRRPPAEGGSPVERYRRIGLDEALALCA